MTYAVVQIQGKQYFVKEGDELLIDRLDSNQDEEVVFPEVLLVKDGDKLMIGDPTVTKASVVATVKTHLKGEKIRVAKYKAKSRYRKVRGHRSLQTTLIINKIKV